MIVEIVNVISELWVALNPAFVSTADYLVGWPILYGIFLITRHMIGKQLKEKAMKLNDVLMGWISTLAIICALVGIVIKVINESTSPEFEFPDVRFEHSLKSVILLVFLLLTVLVIIILVMWKIQYTKEFTVAHQQESNGTDPKLLEDIWKSLRDEMKLVREEIGNTVRKPHRNIPEESIYQVEHEKIDNIESEAKRKLDTRRDPIVSPTFQRAQRSCARCGAYSHKTTKCPYITLTCRQCGLRGHKASMCPHTAHTDSKGRVVTRIENRPGSIKMYHRRDRTQGDALDTTESVINSLHQAVRKRAEKEKERREIKKLAKEIIGLNDSENKESIISEGDIEVDEEETERRSEKKAKLNEETVLANRIAKIIGVNLDD